METIFECHQKDYYNKIFVDRDIINSVVFRKNSIVHKQIERRNGYTYMRVKKRIINQLS